MCVPEAERYQVKVPPSAPRKRSVLLLAGPSARLLGCLPSLLNNKLTFWLAIETKAVLVQHFRRNPCYSVLTCFLFSFVPPFDARCSAHPGPRGFGMHAMMTVSNTNPPKKDSRTFKVRIVYLNAAKTAEDSEVLGRLGIDEDWTEPLVSAPFIKLAGSFFFCVSCLRVCWGVLVVVSSPEGYLALPGDTCRRLKQLSCERSPRRGRKHALNLISRICL